MKIKNFEFVDLELQYISLSSSNTVTFSVPEDFVVTDDFLKECHKLELEFETSVFTKKLLKNLDDKFRELLNKFGYK